MKYIVQALLWVIVGCDTPFFSSNEHNYQTPFEKSDGKKSSTYEEVIDYYKDLSKEFASISFKTMGETDSGQPLHLVIYSPDAEFNLSKYHKNRTIIFVNNATEGDATEGVDATMLLFRNLAQKEIKLSENVIVVTIPVYNIGGMLFGRKESEAQYNLNSDFVKADVENTFSFAKIFREVQPDLFINNGRTSRGGEDFRHLLTYSLSEREKMGSFLGGYLEDVLMPRITDSLLKRQSLFEKDSLSVPFWRPLFEPTTHRAQTAMGYVELWDCLGIDISTHAYHNKPYKQLVEANYEMMKTIIEIVSADNDYIKQLRIKQKEANAVSKDYPVKWEIDSTHQSTREVYTYDEDTITEVYLEARKPTIQQKSYYNRLKVVEQVKVPKSYIVPKIWGKVIDRLKANGVEMTSLEKDTLMVVNAYRIADFKTLSSPFEGHYLHYDTQVTKYQTKKQFYKGDYMVALAQPAKRFLLETLEPQAPDSFFNWNFFDVILKKEEVAHKVLGITDNDISPAYPIYRCDLQ